DSRQGGEVGGGAPDRGARGREGVRLPADGGGGEHGAGHRDVVDQRSGPEQPGVERVEPATLTASNTRPNPASQSRWGSTTSSDSTISSSSSTIGSHAR